MHIPAVSLHGPVTADLPRGCWWPRGVFGGSNGCNEPPPWSSAAPPGHRAGSSCLGFSSVLISTKDKLSVGLKCPGVEEPKDGTGIEFFGISQSGRLLGCGWSLVLGMSRWREREAGEMGRRSLGFQGFCDAQCYFLGSVQECPCQALGISL